MDQEQMKSIREELLIAADITLGRRPRAIPDPRMSLALFLALLSMTASGFAETAYSALRVVGVKRGEEIFKRVIEVRGDGKQEPETWKIVLSDPRAKTGGREIAVRKGRITSDSAPKKPRPAGTPMDLSLLNLDSEGVLAVINQQTEAATSAERIDYTLSNGMERGTPVWMVKLRPPRTRSVTSMEIAADTGEVLAMTLPLADADTQFLSNNAQAGETRYPAAAEAPDERTDSEKPVRTKPSSSRSRESADDVPDLVKSLAKRVGKPVRLLRRFLP